METIITKKPKIILHICCAGCGAYVSRLLALNYEVFLYFENSNIFPKEEYDKRVEEVKRIAKQYKLAYFIEEYSHNMWLDSISGHENDPEKGQRCFICYELRMEAAIKKAKELNLDFFTTTLSVSPYKVYAYIKKIGERLGEKNEVKFLDNDFKKFDGAKKAAELSRELNLYRQNYCGCEFSRRD